MNGNRYFLDTNAIIQLLKGNKQLLNILKNADYIAISIISRLEFLSFPGLSSHDKLLYENFEKCISVIDLSTKNIKLLNAIPSLKINSTLKLPDVIISTSADIYNCILVTADKKLLSQSLCQSISFSSI